MTSPSRPFVARARQVVEFRTALARASAGEPGVLVLGADAGVGKTRLLGRLAEVARGAGARPVVGHCLDLGDDGFPYLPFTEVLGRLADDDAVPGVVERHPALTRLIDPASARPAGSDGPLPLFEGIAAALAACGTPEAPLVVMLEDLHWADGATRDLLRFLVARMRSENLLLVLTYRAEDVHRSHPLRPVLAELVRQERVARVPLDPFTPAELREFTTSLADEPLPEPVFALVARRSEGNAYFAEELVDAGPVAEAGAVPWDLAETLRGRVERLGPVARRLVEIASVGGSRTSDALLRTVGPHEPQLADEVAFEAALAEAVEHHVLGPQGDRLVFRHALLAEAVYESLLPGDRRALHGTYLEALLAEPGLGTDAQAAHHALRADLLPVALEASRRAARTAATVLAPAEELRHLERVVDLWDRVPDAEARTGQRHADVLLDAAAAASRYGDDALAVEHARAALAAAPDAPSRAAMRHLLARHLLATDRPTEAMDEARRGLDELPPDPLQPAYAHTLAAHARASLNAGHDVVARQDAELGVAAARASGAREAEADALTTLAILEADDAEAAAERIVAARTVALEIGDHRTALRCWYNFAENRYYAGHLVDAQAATTEALALATTTGTAWLRHGVYLRVLHELVRYTRGDLSPSVDGSPVPPRSAPSLQAVGLYAAVARGDDAAIEVGRSLRPEWTADAQVALISGGCTIDALAWAGRRAEAVALADDVLVRIGQAPVEYHLGAIWVCSLTISALADLAAERRLVGEDAHDVVARGTDLLAHARNTSERVRPHGGLGPEGRAWLARAVAEGARLAGDADLAAWEDAVRAFGYGFRYEAARSRWRLAEALLERGRRDEAAAAAATALEDATAMGARPLAAAVVALARRGRLDVPGARRAPTAVLTAREEEVLRLVAHGLTNRQIGSTLFISAKTVSVHVSNLLAKLGASGRAEAVSIAHRNGLLPD